MENLKENLAETIAREVRKPFSITNEKATFIAVPDGWKLQDTESQQLTPRRKRSKVSTNDADSFISYIQLHDLASTTIWCDTNYLTGKVAFTAILNDHDSDEFTPDWRDHQATFTPSFSEEWNRWKTADRKIFGQADFAAFIEENLQDIASCEGSPTGAQMLQMALSFEANQDTRFKSAIRLQNGGVQMSFVQDDDAQTLANMQMFDRFSLGLPVFWNGDAYQVDARLRYRVKEGKLSLWYELIRPDKKLESSTKTLIEKIKEETGRAFFFGNPFA